MGGVSCCNCGAVRRRSHAALVILYVQMWSALIKQNTSIKEYNHLLWAKRFQRQYDAIKHDWPLHALSC